MTESSIPWSGTVIGDAGPYSHEVWSDLWLAMFGRSDAANKGVIDNSGNELEVTGAVSPIQVDTGSAFVDGTYYQNTAAVNVVVPSPVIATRYDRIVLRKDWSAQTVRVYRLAGIEGGGVPALTQTDGLIWELPLATLEVTVLGAITITDERSYIDLTPVNLYVNAAAPTVNDDSSAGYEVGDFWADTTTDTVYVCTDNAVGAAVWASISEPATGTDYICINDTKASGVGGGAFNNGAWRTRDLNTEVADTGGHASVAANQITLAAGTYRVRASAPAHVVNRHQTRLQNITDGTTLLVGTSEYTPLSQGKSFVEGRFTIADTKVIELQHQCETSIGSGFGVAHAIWAESEVYSIVVLEREKD